MDGTDLVQFPTNAPIVSTRFERFIHFLGGADSDLLASCPARDSQLIGLIGGLLMAVWIFHVCLITFSLTIAFGSSPQGIAGSFLGALIAATLIVGYDMLVIRALLHERGLKELRAYGLYQAPATEVEGVDGVMNAFVSWLPIIFRFTLSFCAAGLIALFFMLYLYKADINSEIVHQYLIRNAPVVAEASKSVDAQAAALNQSIDADTKVANAAIARKAAVGQALDTAAPDSPEGREMSVLLDELSDLQHKQAQAQDDVRSNQFGANDEAAGIKEFGASGIPKKGERYFARAANIEAAKQQLADYTQRLAAVQAQLAQVKAAAQSSASARANILSHVQDQPDDEERAALSRIAAARAKLAELGNHGQSTLRLAEETKPLSSGPFARIDALHHLTESSAGARLAAISVELFIMSLELSAVIGTLANRIPMTYTRRLAEMDISGAQSSILRLIEGEGRLLAAMQGRPGFTPPLPTPSPPEPPSGNRSDAPARPTDVGDPARSNGKTDASPIKLSPGGQGTAPPNASGSNPGNAEAPARADKPKGIPFIIPHEARTALRRRGYSTEQIREMTPTTAFNILNEH